MDRRELPGNTASFSRSALAVIGLLVLLLCAGCGKQDQASVDGKPDPRVVEEFSAACVKGEIERVKTDLARNPKLATGRNRDGYTPLHLAVSKCRVEIVQMLIDHGADVNAKGKNDLTPLHVVASLGHVTMAEFLLAEGSEIDALDCRNWTPLHYSAMGGHSDVAEFLVNHGAKIGVRNSKGMTALELAEKLGHRKIVKLLESKEETG